MISLREIDRPQDLEIGGIADGAVGVLRRGEIDIGDNRVGWIAGVDRAGERALNPLVLTDRAEARASESRRFHGGDVDLRHARIRGRCNGENADQRSAESCLAHTNPSKSVMHRVSSKKMSCGRLSQGTSAERLLDSLADKSVRL